MKLRTLAFGFVLGVATALLMGEASSGGDKDQDKDPKAAEQEQMMKLWRKYALPGEYHKKLEFFEGEWDVTTKIWMEGPDEAPNVSHATMWNKPIFGGRFIRTTMKGTMSFEFQGKVEEFPVEAVGYMGYDNFKEKYISIWIDSNNTGIYYTEGFVDPSGKIFTFYGEMDEWETGQHDKPYKMQSRIEDEDTIIDEMHDLTMADGKTRVFEMVSRRKK